MMGIARKVRDNFTSFRDIVLFGRIFLLITVLPLLVKFLPLPGLMKFLSGNKTSRPGDADARDYTNRIVKFTDYFLSRNFWVYRKTCLKRTLVLYHFLHPMLGNLCICFGVREKKDASEDKRKSLEGHAWLVQNGEVFLEEKPDLAKKYAVTYCFPGNSPGKEVIINT